MREDVATTLLPDCATPLQDAMSLADAVQLDAQTEIIRTVKDPLRAPEALLPWLALEHRVKHTWDASLSTDRKRAVIAAQYGILRHAGTPGGLSAALAQLGVAADYDEWFEYGGAPYHIRLRVGIGGTVPYTAALDARIWATAIEYKNRRTAIGDFALVRIMPAGGPAMAAAMMIGDDITFVVLGGDVLPPPLRASMVAVMLIQDDFVYGAAGRT